MIDRLVKSDWHRIRGIVVAWEPLSASLCDVKVREADGREVWIASSDLAPIDGWGPLPSRQEARERAREKQVADLEAIRAQLIAEWHKPWPGAEHGKAIIGNAINSALNEDTPLIKTRTLGR